MEQQRVKDPTDLKKDRSQAQEAGQGEDVSAAAEAPNGEGLVAHGFNGLMSNGVSATNGHVHEAVRALSNSGAPPQLDQSWREGPFNKPLGLMMERVAQQCYTDLNRVVGELAETPVRQEPQQVNGITPARDTTAASLEKKRKLMEFASDQRERFVKTLVLSDWSRRADSMARLIDIKAWQNKQNISHMEATRGIGQAKLNMIAAKMPNPNIEGAMEVLSTGKASWIPDLGYIPPKPLSAKQLLDTLRTMNIALSTRINLYEELPPHFQDFSIKDGRVTFRVEYEFEVDLSIAEEEPSSPYYFIDLRFAFRNSGGSLPDDIRPHLEGRVNAALAENGLGGCYDLLHNFVLTHKTNLLRSQAHAMIASHWFDCLRVENMRRSVVLQYWAELNGPKSWVEIGVSSGRFKNATAIEKARQTSAISLRWFRRGVEVVDGLSDIDMSEPDLERVMSQTIARHCSWSLRSIAESMSKPENSQLSMELSESKENPADCSLLMSLPDMRRELCVHIEPVTGRFAISPSSALTERCEDRINNLQDDSTPQRLGSLLCSILQERFGKEAALAGWEPIRGLSWQQSPQTFFGEGFLQWSAYSGSQDWGDLWALAFTFGLNTTRCFFVRLSYSEKGRVVQSAHPLSLEKAFSVSRESLLQLQRLAEAEVSTTTLARELDESNVPYRTERPTVSTEETGVSNQGGLEGPSATMFVKFPVLMRRAKDEGWKSWAEDLMRISYQGMVSNQDHERNTARVQYSIRLVAKPGALCRVQHAFSKRLDSNLSIGPNGAVALRFHAAFGEPALEQLRARLQRLEDLEGCLTAIGMEKRKLTALNLSHMTFEYSANPPLSANLTFTQATTSQQAAIRLVLNPSLKNPHQRIQPMLEQALNGTPSDNLLRSFLFILSFTLSCLQALDKLSATDPKPSIFCRGIACYSLQYISPFPVCKFTMRMRSRVEGSRSKPEWHIYEEVSNNTGSGSKSGEALTTTTRIPEGLRQGLDALWSERGEGWTGIGKSAVADTRSVCAVLERLDGLVKQFNGVPGPAETNASDGTAVGPKPAPGKTDAPKSQKQQAPPSQHQQQQTQPRPQQQGQKPKPEPSKTQAPQGAKKNPTQQQQQQTDVITLD
ncbi:hypothetical protein MBLNU230_g1271t1 [Neophaeotheca triangularis]